MRRLARLSSLAPSGLIVAALIVSTPQAFAQTAGGTDHFKCYVANELSLEQPETASIEDQFGLRPDVLVHNAGWFCNPVAKTVDEVTTGIEEEQNHLTLYPVSKKSPEPARRVLIRNQFGNQDLILTAPRLLAVPTQKEPLPEPTNISHFMCYEARDPSLNVPVGLRDQFHPEDGRVLSATYFCNPAAKTVDDIVTPRELDEDHLACYKITPSDQPPVDFVDIDNQFDEDDTLRVGPSEYLCVPSEKVEVGRPSDKAPEPQLNPEGMVE